MPTDKPGTPCTIGLMDEDTAALMDAPPVEWADVLGISMRAHRAGAGTFLQGDFEVANSRSSRQPLALLVVD
jgi:hypothetical protein